MTINTKRRIKVYLKKQKKRIMDGSGVGLMNFFGMDLLSRPIEKELRGLDFFIEELGKDIGDGISWTEGEELKKMKFQNRILLRQNIKAKEKLEENKRLKAANKRLLKRNQVLTLKQKAANKRLTKPKIEVR